jgi:hypothetical protein
MTDYVVVCRTDAPEREKVIATRRLFPNPQDAGRYAATINESRKPRVITVSEYLIDIEKWRRA